MTHLKTWLKTNIDKCLSLEWWLNNILSGLFNTILIAGAGALSGHIWTSCVVNYVPTMSCKASIPTKASVGTQARTRWTFTLPKRSSFIKPISGILIYRSDDGSFYFEPAKSPEDPEEDQRIEAVSPLIEGPMTGSKGILVTLSQPSHEEIKINLSTVSFKKFEEHSCAKFKFSYL